jgi:membrane associated rhomboid family serine protease
LIPLRDTVRTYSFPIINLTFIGINTLVFIFELTLPQASLDRLFLTLGLVPARLQLTEPLLTLANPLPLLTLLTHPFLHASWFHFIVNIWMLYIFGDNVEDRMGHIQYLVFYLLGGIVSGGLYALINSDSAIPTVGASGAIAGVMGAFFMLYPRARVHSLVFIFLIPWFVQVPALFYLGFWFVAQLFSGLATLGLPDAGGVAWWAHIGGFLFGVIFYRFFTPPVHPAYTRQVSKLP